MTLARTPMQRGRGARTKGGAYEREIVELAQRAGFKEARRNFMSGGAGGGDLTGIPNVHVECKRRETVKVWEWLAQAEADARPTDLAIVAFRRSRSRSYGIVPLEDLLGLLAELQELRSAL